MAEIRAWFEDGEHLIEIAGVTYRTPSAADVSFRHDRMTISFHPDDTGLPITVESWQEAIDGGLLVAVK